MANCAWAATLPPPLSIANIPLVSVQYGPPQVLFILDNSQSMDGDLSGAIMTGSGTATSSSSTNGFVDRSSSSPTNYTVPAGFTAPVSDATSGSTPYTINGVDNSASRLNVAKAAILQAYNEWNGSMQFGLMDYGVNSSPSPYTTWVYYMSGPLGFAFGSSSAAPTQTDPNTGQVAQLQSVPNPCYYNNTQQTYSCQYIRYFFQQNGVTGSFSDPYLYIQDTSDEADINDVLYDNGALPSNFISYGGPTPPNPYPPNDFLSNYNAGSILETYDNATGNGVTNGVTQTGPTNAGYVPYSPEVWYSERGFGYYNTTTNSGNIVIDINQSDHDQTNRFAVDLEPETNNETTTPTPNNPYPIASDAVDAPMSETLQSALSYLQTVPSATCPSKQFVVFVTDGLPTQSNNGSLWPPLGSAAAAGYGETATFNANGTVSSTNDDALTDTISAITALNNAGIKTYVVGLGAGVDPSKNPEAAATLTAMAIAGGTGNYFPATTPAAVANDLNIIMQSIEATMSTSGVSLNAMSGASSSMVYQASFITKLWTGNLKAETLASVLTNPTSPTVSWQATGANPAGTISATSFQNGSTPNVFTWNPACTHSSGCGVPFSWSSLSTTQQTDLENGWNSVTPSQQSSVFNSNAANYGQAIMQWMLSGNNSSGVFRTPSSLLADIVDSSPLFVGSPDEGLLNPSYQTFAQTNANRTPAVYVGTNGGMLDAFNANNGNPLFSYVPNGVIPNLWELPQIGYPHAFYVDGTPTEADVQLKNGSWQSELVGGLGDGGNAIYALNVTNPASFTSSDILWEFTSPYLGLTYSQPQLAEVDVSGTPTWVAVFGSGYNSPAGWPYLFVVNAQTGTLITAVNLCSYLPGSESGYCSTSYPDGLSTPALASSGNGFLVNEAYAGDLQGNLWRVNLEQLLNPPSGTGGSTPPPAVSVLFHATVPGTSTPQSITTEPVAISSPPGAPQGNFILFGTGQLLTTSDLTNGNIQSVYAILDNGSGNTVSESSLQQRQITGATASNGQYVIIGAGTPSMINWAMQNGWYMNLTDSAGGNLPTGLRSITNMQVNLNRLIFTLYAPNTSTCGGSGQSYLMILNYAQGSTFVSPQLFMNNNLSNPLTANGSNASGVSLGSQYAGAPTQTGNHLLIPLGNGTIMPFTLPPPPISPVGWRSIIQ
jgi:type IV pilus assembly protein PilY1